MDEPQDTNLMKALSIQVLHSIQFLILFLYTVPVYLQGKKFFNSPKLIPHRPEKLKVGNKMSDMLIEAVILSFSNYLPDVLISIHAVKSRKRMIRTNIISQINNGERQHILLQI